MMPNMQENKLDSLYAELIAYKQSNHIAKQAYNWSNW